MESQRNQSAACGVRMPDPDSEVESLYGGSLGRKPVPTAPGKRKVVKMPAPDSELESLADFDSTKVQSELHFSTTTSQVDRQKQKSLALNFHKALIKTAGKTFKRQDYNYSYEEPIGPSSAVLAQQMKDNPALVVSLDEEINSENYFFRYPQQQFATIYEETKEKKTAEFGDDSSEGEASSAGEVPDDDEEDCVISCDEGATGVQLNTSSKQTRELRLPPGEKLAAAASRAITRQLTACTEITEVSFLTTTESIDNGQQPESTKLGQTESAQRRKRISSKYDIPTSLKQVDLFSVPVAGGGKLFLGSMVDGDSADYSSGEDK